MLRYFGYGSNTNLTALKRFLREQGVDTKGLRCPQRAILHHHCLRTNYLTATGTGAANVEFCKEHRVEGVLMSVSEAIHQAIRRKEGYPWRYVETWVWVELPTTREIVPAFTFVVASSHQLTYDAPVSSEYRQIILSAAKHIGFSRRYQSQLRSILRIA